MRKIYDAFYFALILEFARRIWDKMTDIDAVDFRVTHHDDSGCFNIMLFDLCVVYSYDKAHVYDMARRIRKVAPEVYLEIVEDENLDLENFMDTIPVSPGQAREIQEIIDDD